MLPSLLAALKFRCNKAAYRPIMPALELLSRNADVDGKTRLSKAAACELMRIACRRSRHLLTQQPLETPRGALLGRTPVQPGEVPTIDRGR
ncbi:hypothetical protein [Saccharopolyspora pogona]|uniref:hypothetical protein n=1 Tax=Saccharopolyspora pogona TaxID=333966 RepID=UPI00168488C2